MVNIDFLISLVLILIMFGIGVSLTIKEIKEVFFKPKALLISLASQMILLPIIAFIISFSFDIPLYIKIGLIILAASPGGTTAGFITYLFNGNVALSIVLTSINSLLTIFTIPLIVNLALYQFYGETSDIHLPFLDTMREIFMLTAIPASLGILLRYLKENIALWIAKYAKPVSILLLGVVFTLKFIGTEEENGMTMQEVIAVLPYALLLNVICLFTGYFVARFFKLGLKNHITVVTESAVHNTTIAFLVSGSLLEHPEFGKVSLVYALFSFWTALLFCYSFIRMEKKSDVQKSSNSTNL